MSGHNKWSSIKHKKAAVDAKRGKIFTKIIREITVAARMGGGDLDMNPTLRNAVLKAKGSNMPLDNINRAIKKGTGELGGQSFEEQLYEGYGPGGVAFMVRALTDNKNRTAAEVRSIFSKRGGNLATQGAVSYMFNRKGVIVVAAENVDEDELFMLVTEAGAEDMHVNGDDYEVICDSDSLEEVKSELEKNNLTLLKAEITQIPETMTPVADEGTAKKILDLVESLEDSDDVQEVIENSEIAEEIIQNLG